jgi:hypothetical protein
MGQNLHPNAAKEPENRTYDPFGFTMSPELCASKKISSGGKIG